MKTLKEIIQEARAGNRAIGHFNISNIEGLWAIFQAAREFDMPVIIGLSEGERGAVGTRQAVALVKSIREEFDYPIFINADHCHSFESFKEAVDAGFDAAIIDGAALPLEENIALTKKCAEYAHAANPEILVEGELGYIGSSSKMLDEIPEEVSLDNLTTAADAKKFVEETGVDLFSPSIGNIHGMLKKSGNPELNIGRIKEIAAALAVPLVLHGGSGISDKNFREAIAAGVAIVHINTEIRRTYRAALEEALKADPEQIAPYKITKPAIEAMQRVIKKRIKLFARKNREKNKMDFS